MLDRTFGVSSAVCPLLISLLEAVLTGCSNRAVLVFRDDVTVDGDRFSV